MAKYEEYAVVMSQEMIANDIYSLWIGTDNMAGEAVAGQFISMYTEDKSKLLPRPISICEVDREKKALRLVYRVTGQDTGTEQFSKLVSNDKIRVLGPLGNGFTLYSDESAMLIAGGIGIPPMVETAKQLKASGCEDISVVVGYRDADTFLLEEFNQYGKVYVATEDGSIGTKGNVINAIESQQLKAQNIYSCGPTPMLKAVKEFGLGNGIRTQVSLEEKMACGIGACLACVCKTKEKSSHTNVNNTRICKEGPVFLAEEVLN